MHRSTVTVLRGSVRLGSQLRLPYSTSSASRLAKVVPTSPAKPAPEPPLRPQPFIPQPLSRKHQVASLAKSSSGSASTTISLSGPSSLTLTLPNLFLRDSSHHPAHIHPASQQKLFRTTDIPLDAEVVGYGVHEVAGEDCLVMEWSKAIPGVGKGGEKLSVHPVSFLVRMAEAERGAAAGRGVGIPGAKTWDFEGLLPVLRKTPYAEYAASNKALLSTLDGLLESGIAFLSGVPSVAKEGDETELKKLGERIGSLRRTWYGYLWDVKAEEGSANIAYTNLDLGLHMDLTHFESPPRYQFLHCLLNASITGGASYFVDSFHLASLLRHSHPTIFHTLSTVPVLFEYHNGGQHTRWSRPTIELDASGEIWAVNYSPPFQGPLLLPSGSTKDAEQQLAALHHALGVFADMCADERYRYEVQLEAGDCVVFDNRRVLHARTAFEFREGAEGGERGRWLKGAYCDGDEVWSRWRVLEAERREGKLV